MMKKPASGDINNLFRKFGGDATGYQEIKQNYVGEKAQQNWPIVNAMQADRGSVSGSHPVPMFAGLQRQQGGAAAGLVGARSGHYAAYVNPSAQGAAVSAKPTLRKLAEPAGEAATVAASGMLFAAPPTAGDDSVMALFARLRNDPQSARPIAPTMPGLRGLFGALAKAK